MLESAIGGIVVPLFDEELKISFFNALRLKVEDITLSDTEWQYLSNYLYIHELLLSCQRSSIGISRKAWESLKERLLTV